MGITLYNKVPEQIKLKENFNSSKRDLRSFLLKCSIYSVDEFMSLKLWSECVMVLCYDKYLVLT
jgi:hypothetical protein